MKRSFPGGLGQHPIPALVLGACILAATAAHAGEIPYDGSPRSKSSGFVVVENTWSARLREKPEPASNDQLLINWQLGYLHRLDVTGLAYD